MSKFDLGLSNIYLKFGVALLFLSVVVALWAFAFNGSAYTSHAIVFLLTGGMVFYIIGRIVKATRVSRK